MQTIAKVVVLYVSRFLLITLFTEIRITNLYSMFRFQGNLGHKSS